MLWSTKTIGPIAKTVESNRVFFKGEEMNYVLIMIPKKIRLHQYNSFDQAKLCFNRINTNLNKKIICTIYT